MSNRPAGTTAAVAGLIVTIASLAGVEISAEAAASIVGGLAALVSLFYPLPEYRQRGA